MAFRRHRAGDKINRRGAEGRTPAGEREAEGERPPRSLKSSSAEKARERVMATALKMLAARARSEQQLRERLLLKRWADPALIDECIARLKQLGYINDEAFAHSYAASRVSLRAVGRSRIARELKTRKVSTRTIDSALDSVFEETSEEALIDRAIAKRVRTHGAPEDRAAVKRLFDHLARLGFGYDLIIRKLRALKAEVDEG